MISKDVNGVLQSFANRGEVGILSQLNVLPRIKGEKNATEMFPCPVYTCFWKKNTPGKNPWMLEC